MMNDNARLQESLLPISHNAPGLVAQQAQRGGGGAQQQPYVVRTADGRYQPVATASYVTTTTSSSSARDGNDSWGKARRYCWWVAVILTVVLVFTIIALKLFLFKPISKGPPKLDNSTAMEPNTKTRFNLLTEGPRNRVQGLVGASAWIYTIPIPTHPKLVLAAVGLYVERAEGKRRLRRFKGEEMTDELFEDVKAILSVPGGMTESMRVVLSTTPPSGRMLEMWQDNTRPVLDRVCPALADDEWNAFASFFPDPFNKGDDFTFEWREGTELYGFKKGESRAKAKRIGGPCMARALFESQMDAQKSAIVNLLDDFFER